VAVPPGAGVPLRGGTHPAVAAPFPCVIPRGFSLSEEGVKRNGRLLSRTAFVVDACFLDPTGQDYLRFAWKDRGRTKRKLILRSDALAGKFSELSRLGLDLGTHNARALARYVQGFDAPESHISHQQGWTPDMRAFLWGEYRIDSRGTATADPLMMDTSGPCLAPILPDFTKGFWENGTWDGWLEAAREAGKYPRVALAIYAAALPPMLRVLDAPSCAIRFSGPGSSGKSVAVLLAGSAWGSSASIFPWGASREWLEQAAVACNDLPLMLDDPRQGQDFGDRFHALLAGTTRGRVERGRPVPAMAWSTCVISSGTSSLEDVGDDGLASRVVDLWGSPWGGQDAKTSESVSTVLEAIQANHGHFGPLLVQRLIQARDLWPKWRALYLENRKEGARKGAELGSLGARSAQTVATFRTVAAVVHALFPEFEWKAEPSLDDLWHWVQLGASGEPEAKAGLTAVAEWASKERLRIFGMHKSRGFSIEELVPPGGWIGRTDDQGHVWLQKGLVAEVLVEAGFLPEKIVREWWAGGELLPGHAGTPVARKRLGNFNPPCLGFSTLSLKV